MPKGVYIKTKKHLLQMKKNGFQEGGIGFWAGKKRPNMSARMKGNKIWDNPNSIKNQFKKGVSNNTGRDNPMYGITGDKHPKWKGGLTPENERIRKSMEAKLWKKAVYTRDNFTCQKYGIRGGRLVAHHIQNFSDFPELRFAIDNGMTLSEKAHKEFHKKYGLKNNTREQLEEFLSTY